jgi:hypothetical protein
MDKKYFRREWLNPEGSTSTGTIIAYYGKLDFFRNKHTGGMLEISDCTFKIRLHQKESENEKAFIVKLKLLRDVLNEFIAFLEGLEGD